MQILITGGAGFIGGHLAERREKAGHDADVQHTHADVSKARDLIDYDHVYTISKGEDAFIEWYRENSGWYEPLTATA